MTETTRPWRETSVKVSDTSGTREEVDCDSDRYLVVTNGGPDTLYLSEAATGATLETLDPPAHGEEASRATFSGHRVLRSAGRSHARIQEFYADGFSADRVRPAAWSEGEPA